VSCGNLGIAATAVIDAGGGAGSGGAGATTLGTLAAAAVWCRRRPVDRGRDRDDRGVLAANAAQPAVVA
jgi:hypothetical protein